jgi:8-oxo-dGTP diphosphatase
MIEFSTNDPKTNIHYNQRIGAYAIINNDGLIATVKNKTGYFLPGGGIENNESMEKCLQRECLEEIGAEIAVLNKFAHGNCYFYSNVLKIHRENDGYFFVCKIRKIHDATFETDHKLIWMNIDEAIQCLFMDNQKEALKIFNNEINR